MKSSNKNWLRHHSAHDYQELTEHWRKLAEKVGLDFITLCSQGGNEIFALQGEGKSGSEEGLYFSAGVHGDEAAPVWGLLEWAESNAALLKREAVTILPCVNPWGFINNVRTDFRGRDLNRLFHNKTLPFFKAWRKLVGERRFRLALNLHEDYDARGIYVYELSSSGRYIAEKVFAQIESIIQRESRTNIDGLPMRRGIIRRSGDLRKAVEEQLEGGWPEAVFLYEFHATTAMTFETPSEFAFHERVKAQSRFIQAALNI